MRESTRGSKAEHAGEPERAAQALASVAMAALWADGREHPNEQALVAVELANLPGLADEGPDAIHEMIAGARERYVEKGPEELVRQAAKELDPERREQALTLAVDVMLVDRRVTDEEGAFLEELVRVLDLEPARIEEVVSVLEEKHDILFEPEQPLAQPSDHPLDSVSTQQAIIAFALAAVDATGQEDLSGRLGKADLGLNRGLASLPAKRREAMLESIRKAFEQEGVDAYLERCAASLSPRAAERAFTWAADIALADKRLTEPEHAFLTEARELLGVPPVEAGRIVDVLWAKHLR